MESFAELSLSTPISKAIEEMGFTKPSPIQAQALPILLGDATDFIGLAATGTGKTAAFAIPLLENIDANASGVQALILCPTRELALQVATQVNLIGRFKRVRSVAVYGGASYGEQIRGLRDGAQVVVGTPGRVCDHIERGTLILNDVKTIVLDEADEMISMGFKDDLEKVLSAMTPDMRKIWLFSATMSREVRRVADTYLMKPKQIQVNRDEMLSATIEQYYYPVQETNKAEILCKLIDGAEDFYGLIFCQTKALAVDLTQYLNDRGYKAESLHGDKDQSARERTMQAFRNRRVTILVCTDVASRGIDVKDITHVVNFSLPRELENYVHRIGRTARSGKTGVAMNLVTASHRRLIQAIERHTNSRMLEGRIPTRREIGARSVAKRLSAFMDQPFHSRAIEVMSDEWREALAGMTAEEVAGRFLTMATPDLFSDRPGHGGSPVSPSAQHGSPPPPRPSSRPSVGATSTAFNAASRPTVTASPVPAVTNSLHSASGSSAARDEVAATTHLSAEAKLPMEIAIDEMIAQVESELDSPPAAITQAPKVLVDEPRSAARPEARPEPRSDARARHAKPVRPSVSQFRKPLPRRDFDANATFGSRERVDERPDDRSDDRSRSRFGDRSERSFGDGERMPKRVRTGPAARKFDFASSDHRGERSASSPLGVARDSQRGPRSDFAGSRGGGFGKSSAGGFGSGSGRPIREGQRDQKRGEFDRAGQVGREGREGRFFGGAANRDGQFDGQRAETRSDKPRGERRFAAPMVGGKVKRARKSQPGSLR